MANHCNCRRNHHRCDRLFDAVRTMHNPTSHHHHHHHHYPLTQLYPFSNYTVLIKHLRPAFQNFRHSSPFSCRKHRHWCLSPVPATFNFLPSSRSLAFFFFFLLRVVVAVLEAPFPCTDSNSVFSELQKPSVS